MATVINDRDVLIMGATSRFNPPTDRGMFLMPSTAVFKMASNGLTASPSSFTFTATLLNMAGAVSWSWTGGMSLSVNGNTATLDLANFSAVSGIVSASITVDGQIYTQTATVTKVADGSVGPQGVRGNVDIAAVTSGSVWSDSEAAAALAAAGYGAPQVRDMVTLYKADRTFSAQKMYSGSAWIAVDYVWNGNVFVKGSILPEAIDTRGLLVRDADGNVILGAGVVPPGTKNSDIKVGGRNLYKRTSPFTVLVAGSSLLGRLDTGFQLGGNANNTGHMRLEGVITKNGEFTVSFDLATSSTGGIPLTIDVCDGQSWTISPPAPGDGPQHFEKTFTVTNWSAVPYNFVDFTGLSAQTHSFTNFKVEEGNKATAWTLAPEDVQAGIDAAAAAGATIGSNLYGQMTAANISTYIAAAAIRLALIDTASIGSLSALSAVIGLLRTASSGQRSELSDNGLQLFNSANVPVVQVGFF